MITVSNDFKDAIKRANREIYGYVEVEYQNKSFDTTITQIPEQSNIVVEDGLLKGEKTMQKYATLENNYTLLDGSFMVWNENTLLSSGYISNDVFEDITDSTIIITNNSTDLSTKGVTIYFRENLPFDFTVTLTNTDGEEITDVVTNNQSYIYQYLLYEEQNISTVKIEISRMEYPSNRLRIAYVDFNISYLYEGDELVKFDVTEEIDLLFDSIPIGTCIININNYPDDNGMSKFDVINPKGITAYLNEDTIVKPYIGVLTELNGIEYVPMGVFYLKDWSSNQDGNMTINCENIISKLQNTTISSNGSFLGEYQSISSFNSQFHDMTGYDFELVGVNPYIHCSFLKTFNLLDWLRCFSISQTISYDSDTNTYRKQQFRITRDNVIKVDYLPNIIADKISRNELKSDVNYEIKSVINEVSIADTSYAQTYSSDTKTLVDENYTLTDEVKYIWYKLSDMATSRTLSYSVVSGNATVELIDSNFFLIYVKVTGTIGSEVHISCTGKTYSKISDRSLTFSNDLKYGDKLELDYNQYWHYIIRYKADLVSNYCLTQDKKYKVTAETMGDPSLEVGDTISIQTRYTNVNNGYKDIILTKQQFTFDGGLQCTLEGLGD